MNPVTHLLVGWGVANTAVLERRDRALVTIAAVIPDVDGLGILVAAAACLAKRRAVTAFLAAVAFHLHILGDIAGSRGPDGYQWPVPYLRPFSDAWQLTWSGQWELDAWPNFAITTALLVLTLYLAWKRGHSPIELLSKRADRGFVSALRHRFGQPEPHPESEARP
jgi:hypothetical protein